MWGERIKKYPWSWVFAFIFLGAVFCIWNMGPVYQTAGLPALWLLLLIALADQKYMIIPDQLVVALAVTAIGFVPFQEDFLSPLYGALIGGGSLLIIGTIGRWISKKDVMGFGDVKLMAAIGLVSGVKVCDHTPFDVPLCRNSHGFCLLSGRLKEEDDSFLPINFGAASPPLFFSPRSYCWQTVPCYLLGLLFHFLFCYAIIK